MLMHGNRRLFLTPFSGLSVGLSLGLTLAISFSLSPVLQAQDAEDAARQHFAAAQQAQASGNLELAAQEYAKVSRMMPDVAEVWASLGMVYHAQGKYSDSAQALAKAVKLKPGLPGVNLYLGIDYEKQRQPALAVPHLIDAIHLEPQNKQAHTWLGRALWDEGKVPAALDQIRKTSQAFPSDPALLLDLGVAYRKAAELSIEHVLSGTPGTALMHQVYGDIYRDEQAWENSAAHYYRALELDPHWQGAHFGLGEIALRRDKLETARQEFQRELETNPKSAAAQARLGEIALLENDGTTALSHLDSAARANSFQAASALGLPHPYPIASQDLSGTAQQQMRTALPGLAAAAPGAGRSLGLAFAQARLGNESASTSAWQQFVVTAPPSSETTPSERAWNHFYRQDFAAAAHEWEAWLKLHPEDFAVTYSLARAYQNLSLVTLAQLLATAPDSYAAHELLAETYQNAGNDAEALSEYKTVESMAPNLPGVHFSVGHLLLKTHQADQAREELEAELRLNPDNPGANAEMGTLLLDRQDAANAIPYLEKALAADRSQWNTYQQLGRAYYMQKDFTKAEAALKQAVRHDPKGLAHYQLALVYRSLGQKEAANQEFEISRKLKLDSLVHDEGQMNTLQSLPQ